MRLANVSAAAVGERAAERRASRPSRLLRPLSLGAVAVLLLSAVVSAAYGAVEIPAGTIAAMLLSQVPVIGDLIVGTPTWTPAEEAVILQIRLPRIMLAVVVGGALAVSGATYQGMFRNPLAEPYLIGVAPGAGLGAVIALALPLPALFYSVGVVQWFAFAGALATVVVVAMLARVGRSMPLTTLLLAGVALGSFTTAMTSFLMYMQQDKLHIAYSWLLGGLSLASWPQMATVAPYLLLSWLAIVLNARRLNVLQLDEEQAAQLGINVERLKIILVAAATLATAAAVSVCGLSGFVGLIVPHAVRLLWGPDYRVLVPMSTLCGAVFMLWADTVARSLLAPTEIPVGVVTALCGAPFFLILLRKRKAMVF